MLRFIVPNVASFKHSQPVVADLLERFIKPCLHPTQCPRANGSTKTSCKLKQPPIIRIGLGGGRVPYCNCSMIYPETNPLLIIEAPKNTPNLDYEAERAREQVPRRMELKSSAV